MPSAAFLAGYQKQGGPLTSAAESRLAVLSVYMLETLGHFRALDEGVLHGRLCKGGGDWVTLMHACSSSR